MAIHRIHTSKLAVLFVVAWLGTTRVIAQDCAAGAEPDGSGACTSCHHGKFSSSLDNSSCAPCPTGSFAAAGATTCTPCTVGLYDHDHSAETACEYCPIGTFTSESGAVSCQSCYDGSRWVRVRSGEHERPEACATCPVGFFERTPSADYCEKCVPGSFSPPVVQPPPANQPCASSEVFLEIDYTVRSLAILRLRPVQDGSWH